MSLIVGRVSPQLFCPFLPILRKIPFDDKVFQLWRHFCPMCSSLLSPLFPQSRSSVGRSAFFRSRRHSAYLVWELCRNPSCRRWCMRTCSRSCLLDLDLPSFSSSLSLPVCRSLLLLEFSSLILIPTPDVPAVPKLSVSPVMLVHTQDIGPELSVSLYASPNVVKLFRIGTIHPWFPCASSSRRSHHIHVETTQYPHSSLPST